MAYEQRDHGGAGAAGVGGAEGGGFVRARGRREFSSFLLVTSTSRSRLSFRAQHKSAYSIAAAAEMDPKRDPNFLFLYPA
jgi:hypothetical protein